ncbi:uncharacterized protein LOC144436342 [Glandiceps talaboti]
MGFIDTLHHHWKKLAIIGVLAVVGICIAIGLAVSKDVEQPADAEVSEGGNFGAQKGHDKGSSSSENVGSGSIVSNGVEVPAKLRPFNKEHVMPNFFAREVDPETGELTPPDSAYRGGYVIFVLNQHSGGQIMKLCMERLSANDDVLLLTANNYAEKVKEIKDNKKISHKFVAGDMTLGICDFVPDSKCSYFTVFSSAAERMLLSYVTWCQSDRARCEETTLPEFAKRHGNYFLKQLMQTYTSNTGESNLDEAMKGIEEKTLNMALSGMSAWFAGICTTANIDECFLTLQHLYGLPFHDTCGGEHLGSLRTEVTSKSSPSDEFMDIFKAQVAGGATEKAITFHNLMNILRQQIDTDTDLKPCMHADEMISIKAKEMFESENEGRRRRG